MEPDGSVLDDQLGDLVGPEHVPVQPLHVAVHNRQVFYLAPGSKTKKVQEQEKHKEIQKTFGARQPCWQGWCSHRALQCPGYGAFLHSLCQDFGCGLAQYDLKV